MTSSVFSVPVASARRRRVASRVCGRADRSIARAVADSRRALAAFVPRRVPRAPSRKTRHARALYAHRDQSDKRILIDSVESPSNDVERREIAAPSATRRRDGATNDASRRRAARRGARAHRARDDGRAASRAADRARLPRDARDERCGRRRRAIARRGARRVRLGRAIARRTARDGTDARQWIERISESPRAYVYRNFLTREEAEATIAAARRTMRRSEVVNEADGTSKTSDERTSSGGWVSGDGNGGDGERRADGSRRGRCCREIEGRRRR